MLLKRFQHEKCKLLSKYGTGDAIFWTNSTTCDFGSEMLCSRSGFDSWCDIHPIVDCASCFLDMELLQELSLLIFVDSGDLQRVSGQLFSSYYILFLNGKFFFFALLFYLKSMNRHT